MLELADIFSEYGDAYFQKYGSKILPSHRKALWDIEHCRTEAMGGEMYYCPDCHLYHYSYHSCGNRHCPKCEGERADRWRDKQLEKLLPVPSFLVTFTLPHPLTPIAHSNQKLIYSLVFKASSETLQALALNPDFIGGKLGMVGVLHTWDRSMGYHLHIHYLIPAGAVAPKTGQWNPSHPTFLLPIWALQKVFCAKFRDAFKEAAPKLFAQVPKHTWRKKWVVHSKPVGDGRKALKYLAPYVYRVAISNRRLVSLKDGKVTFRYKPNNKPWQTMTLDVMSFIQRFLQHVLPKGFQKVRYFGLLHPSAKKTFTTLQQQLNTTEQNIPPPANVTQEEQASEDTTVKKTPICCPQCGGPLEYIGRFSPHQNTRGPP